MRAPRRGSGPWALEMVIVIQDLDHSHGELAQATGLLAHCLDPGGSRFACHAQRIWTLGPWIWRQLYTFDTFSLDSDRIRIGSDRIGLGSDSDRIGSDRIGSDKRFNINESIARTQQ